jgi:Fe-S cluster biogenesis protein NfuA/nitrite reductase/ring-hydroxylating ferredoxin subunit
VQELTAALDELPDVRARELAQELVGAVIAMYGDGLERIIATIVAAREAGATILDELAGDGAVASLLLIHDLYPVPLRERVIEALDTVRPYMESHGGDVELVSLEQGVATLALQGSCNGCAASRATLELAIKQALEEHAPDLVGLEVHGVTDPGVGHAPPIESQKMRNGAAGGLELPMFHAGAPAELPVIGAAQPSPARWRSLEPGTAVAPGQLSAIVLDGAALLLANVGGSMLAYRDACAACGEPLADGALDAHGILDCPHCGIAFDLPGAGRAAGGEPLQLTPVPLLSSGGLRVAVAG